MRTVVERLRELAEHNRKHFAYTSEEGFYALGDEAAALIELYEEALFDIRSRILCPVGPAPSSTKSM
jgi:hypothetical protein